MYDLTGKQKKLEFDLFCDALDEITLQYESDYGIDYDFEDTMTKRKENWYDGEQKFYLIINNVIKKLDLLNIKYILKKEKITNTIENKFTIYNENSYKYHFLFPDQELKFKISHLSTEEKAFCSIEIFFLLLLNRMKLTSQELTRIYGMPIDEQKHRRMRELIKESLNCKILKGTKRGYYSIVAKLLEDE